MNYTMKRTSPSQPGFNAAWAAAWLQRQGWRRDIAGERDFSAAVRAMVELAADRNKSLLLIGQVGVGKTALAKIVCSAVRTPVVRINCAESEDVDLLVPESDSAINNGVFNSEAGALLARTVFIDDMGAEPILKSFGNELDRVGNFVVRYHLRGSGRLIVTTNLSGGELEAKYGARVFDRLLDMSVVVRLSGGSKRGRTIVNAGRDDRKVTSTGQ